MPSLTKDVSLADIQEFNGQVYGLPNDRHFSLWEMLSNVERFAFRGLKGIRKEDREKAVFNLLISFSWFVSTLNRIHINLDDQVWHRFPNVCSYCGTIPCSCKERKPEIRKKVLPDPEKRPGTLRNFQEMFNSIYPSDKRSLEHAGVHLAEELGEFSEAMMAYSGGHRDEEFKNIMAEAADVFSCFAGIFNSLKADMAGEMAELFKNNCHECGKAPCECKFDFVVNYRS